MKEAVSWVIKGEMHVQWWWRRFFICTLSCFICGPCPLGGRRKCTTLFLYFHCIYVKNTINPSCGSFFPLFMAHHQNKGLKVWTQTIRSSTKGKKKWGGKKKNPKLMWFVVFLEKFIDKYNIMILYSISIHTWFDWDSLKMSICSSSCLSVDLKVCLGDAGAATHLSRDFLWLDLVAQWVGTTVNHF